MALSADALYARRGSGGSHNEFGYQVKAGEKIYLGAVVGVNSAGTLQKMQTSGTVALSLGLADRRLDNSAGSAASDGYVVILKGTWRIPVPSATAANIGAAVYVTDDGTFTLTSTDAVAFGTLAGIDGGATYVRINGS